MSERNPGQDTSASAATRPRTGAVALVLLLLLCGGISACDGNTSADGNANGSGGRTGHVKLGLPF